MIFQIACGVCSKADKRAINTEPGELISENLISAMQKFSSEKPIASHKCYSREKKTEPSITVVVSQEQPHSNVGSVHVYVTARNVCRALPLQEEEGQQQDAACRAPLAIHVAAQYIGTARGSRQLAAERCWRPMATSCLYLSAPEQGVLLPALCVLTASFCVCAAQSFLKTDWGGMTKDAWYHFQTHRTVV